MKFLIVRFSSIGDIVLTTPVLRCLKQQVPGAEVHYLTKSAFRIQLAHNPYIDQLHLLQENNREQLLAQLKEEQFDYLIDLHHNLRTLRIKLALKNVQSFSFNKLNLQKWLLTALKINRLPGRHIVDRYLDTLRRFGVTNDGKGLDYFIPAEDVVPAGDLPTSHQAGFLAVVIGAALPTKQMPLHKLQELCSRVQHPLVLLGGPEDKALGDAIAALDPVKIYNACGKFNLNESADLVQKAKSVITHDTGLMHIAAAFKKPILSIWGNTVPAFGMTPYYGTATIPSAIFEVTPLSCRPCSKIGHRKCPKGHFNCMQQQDVAAIARTAAAWVQPRK